MTRWLLAAAVLMLGCAADDPQVAPWPPPELAGRTLLGIFEGKFPCDDCNRLKTALALYQGDRYALRQIRVGDEGVRDGQGTWITTRGARTWPDAQVVELRPDDAGPATAYLKVDDNVLLLLDGERNVRVGNAALSFALNRTR